MYPLKIANDIEFAGSILLSAGELKCLYEKGNLVQIRFGEQELIRKIYAAVRLHNWDTLPVLIGEEEIETDSTSFKITYTAIFGKTIPLFRAKYSITGGANNSIRVSMEGKVLEEFSRNRIGLCVLHPVPQTEGAAAVVTRADGSEYEGKFPVDISPHQPFFDISGIRWTDHSGNRLSLHFEGDIFEMEDQRNWSDHSFKTYSTPLSLERPVALEKDERIYQSLEFRAELPGGKSLQQQFLPAKDMGKKTGADLPENKTLSSKYNLPKIGYSLPIHTAVDDSLLEILQTIPMHHLRVSIHLSDPEWNSAVQWALNIAEKLSVRLELLMTLDDVDSIHEFITGFSAEGRILYSILPIISREKFAFVYDRLKLAFPQTLVGYGSDDSFANLNRNRPSHLSFDFLSFAITPQAHASDNRTIVENLFSHADMIKTARSFANEKPIHVSPITLIDRGLAEKADERQYSSFLAGWAAHFFQTFAGIASITFFDISGENGIVKKENENIILSPFFKILQALHDFGAVSVLSSANVPAREIIFENAGGDQLKIYTDILSQIAIENA